MVDVSQASLPTSRSLLEEAWTLFKAHAPVYLAIQAIATAFLLVPVIFIIISSVTVSYTSTASFLVALIGFVVLSMFSFLVMLLGVSWSSASLFVAIKNRDNRSGVKDSFTEAWHKLGSYWWILLLTAVITLGGYFFFFIPGIMFSVWFSFGIIVLFVEGEKGIRALLKSREYVRGRFWPVVWKLFCISCVYFLCFLTMRVFVDVVLLLLAPAMSPNLVSTLSQNISQIVTMIFITPVMAVYLFLLYEKLKALRGTFVFNPHAKQEVGYIVAGIFGIACMFLLIVGIAFTATHPELVNTPSGCPYPQGRTFHNGQWSPCMGL